MTNRQENFVVAKIDRDKEWAAERGRLLVEARETVDAFMAPFHLAEERAAAADALARALAPVLTRFSGSVGAATRFSALSARADDKPVLLRRRS